MALLAALDAGGTPDVALGVATAWTIQAPAFWTLVGALSRGGSVLRVWAGGIAARVAGFAVLAVVGGLPGLARLDILLAYAGAILAYLLMEAMWLWRWQGRARKGGGRGRRDAARTGKVSHRSEAAAPNGDT